MLFSWTVNRIIKDELLGYLTDFHGRKVFEARAPKDGLLLLIVTAPPIQKGETVAIVARTQQVVARKIQSSKTPLTAHFHLTQKHPVYISGPLT